MVLANEQAAYFYQLWIPLLSFVNQKHGIDKSLRNLTSPKGLPIATVKKLRDALWKEPSLIDSYIAQSQPSAEDAKILSSWKGAVQDTFVILRHLKSGSVFLPIHQEDNAYIVQGIYSTWDEMLQGTPLPQYVDVVLLPFGDTIIFDSILISHHACLVGDMKRTVEEQYRRIKAAGGVKKRLDGEEAAGAFGCRQI